MSHSTGSSETNWQNIEERSSPLDKHFEDIFGTVENNCKENEDNHLKCLTDSVPLSAEKLNDLSRKNKEQWSKILKVFEPVKNMSTETPKRHSLCRRSFCKPYAKWTFLQNSSRSNNQITVLAKSAKCEKLKPNCSMKVENSRPTVSRYLVERTNQNTTSKALTPPSNTLQTTEIDCSAGSNDDCRIESDTIVWKSNKYSNPETELDAFIKVIEKDFRQTQRIYRRKADTETHSALCKKAVSRARADLGFLNYEQRMGIRNGVIGNVTEIKMSYGVCLSTLQEGNAALRCFVLDKSMQSVEVGSNLVSFVDNDNYYMVNNLKTYIQSNKLVQQE